MSKEKQNLDCSKTKIEVTIKYIPSLSFVEAKGVKTSTSDKISMIFAQTWQACIKPENCPYLKALW